MKRILSIALGVSLVFSPLGVLAQKTKRSAIKSAADKPVTARFIVRATLDKDFKSVKNAANEKVNWTSRLHLELEARRWVVIGKADDGGGGVEFMQLEGGEPAAASGNLTLAAVSDGGTAETHITDTANFSGAIQTDGATISTPEFSELGDGISFRISVSAKMLGACRVKITSSDGKNIDSSDCDDSTATMAQGIVDRSKNQDAGKTAATSTVVRYMQDFEIEPKLNLRMGNIPEETRKQMEESFRRQEQLMGAPKWFGAETRGDRQAGYKITFSGTKDLPVKNEGDESGEWKQKLTVTAEIIPGASKTAFLDLINEAPPANAQFLTLKEIIEKQS